MVEEAKKTSTTEPTQEPSIKNRWTKLHGLKTQMLSRARQCAALTIPALLPPEGHTEQMQLATPWQGLGARGVNNLASKLMLAIMPPNTPCFRMMVDDLTIEKLTKDKNAKDEIDKALSKIERGTMDWIETSKSRVPVFEALRLLIATGNALLYVPNKGGVKTYKLDQYCVKRDPMGNLLEIILMERIHPEALPASVKEVAEAATKNTDETVDLYTHVVRKDNKWVVRQEVADKPITESAGSFAIDDCPYIALRWTAVTGEDYGRGLVEEYIGDLVSLEGLWQAIVEGSVAAAKVLFLVNPNGTTSADKMSKTPNGGFVSGKEGDVHVLQMQKYADFQTAEKSIERLESRLAYAFLLNSSVQRNAERVTAEEIRYIAGELEDSLGGVYSMLAQEMQLPFIQRMMKQMRFANKMPAIPKEIKPVITTGLEALGRGHDLNKLDMFIQHLTPLGEQTVSENLNVPNYITRVGTSLGINTDGLVNDPETIAANRQQTIMAQMASSSMPRVAGEVAKGVMSGDNGQQFGQAMAGAMNGAPEKK